MKSKKFKTQMLGGINAGSAWDLDIHSNDINNGRVIFSFNTESQLNEFTAGLQDLLRKTECWGGLDSLNSIPEGR